MNLDAFLLTLPVVVKGMSGIFIVMIIIFACIKLMTRASSTDK